MSVRDWTQGGDGIVYHRCESCGASWYFARGFCPKCGHAGVITLQASGQGHVYAITHIHRAPHESQKALVPYAVVLVDTVEGFRMMGHGALDLAIGDPVKARFIDFQTVRAPYFERAAST